LVVTFAVDTFKRMWAQFALFSFEIERVNLEVGLAIPGEVAMMFNLVWPIALKILGTL